MSREWTDRILIVGLVVALGATAGFVGYVNQGREVPMETWALGLPGEQEIVVRAEDCRLSVIDQRGFADSHEDATMEALCWNGHYGFVGPENVVFEGLVLYGYQVEAVEAREGEK